MKYLFTVMAFSISLLSFGQNSTNISVRINSEPLDSLPKFVVKLNEKEYHLDALPDSFNREWIEKIEVWRGEKDLHKPRMGNGVIVVFPRNQYFKQVHNLLEKTSISQDQKIIESRKIEKIVNDFFNWYIKVSTAHKGTEFLPQIVESETGMTTIDFSKYFENLRRHQFCESLIEAEWSTYQECIHHLEKVKYSDFKTNWVDLDDFESTNCDFANSHRWTGGMEPANCIRIVEVKVLSNRDGLVRLKRCGRDSSGNEEMWGSTTVTLKKQDGNWKITRIG